MGDTLTELVEKHPDYPAFMDWLRDQSRVQMKDTTVRNYLMQMEHMRRGYGLVLEGTPTIVEAVRQMRENSLATSTMNVRRQVMLHWLGFKGIEPDDDMKNSLAMKRGQKKRKLHSQDLLSLAEVRDIVEHTPHRSHSAYFYCLWDIGCRPSALIRLRVADVMADQYGFVFVIRRAKNEQSKRTVRLMVPAAIAAFEKWWSEHPRRDNSNAHVFLNARGAPLTRRTMLTYLKQHHQDRLRRDNGRSPLNLYLFRFSRATQLLRDNVLKEIEVKRRLGHKPGSMMLEKCYAILSEEDQADAELRSMGFMPEENGRQQPRICPSCSCPNEADATICQRCRLPLTEKESQRQQQIAIQQARTSLLSDDESLRAIADAVADAILQKRDPYRD